MPPLQAMHHNPKNEYARLANWADQACKVGLDIALAAHGTPMILFMESLSFSSWFSGLGSLEILLQICRSRLDHISFKSVSACYYDHSRRLELLKYDIDHVFTDVAHLLPAAVVEAAKKAQDYAGAKAVVDHCQSVFLEDTFLVYTGLVLDTRAFRIRRTRRFGTVYSNFSNSLVIVPSCCQSTTYHVIIFPCSQNIVNSI